ncbi:WD40 repeat-like protein [Fomitiporia mediterranea MF3/22]|uniref:WD40 repeat-like protein n=1 Tax=Fomitiporia mediterranea (strain MF3/22) TaxID=694068 RepID=UPI0004407E3E|nr:WD40 repeat-like protein [Fomitiporia mediterranea MF3/22]EJD02149.1 WD40 repeat-like protein [Fomitiporia mediterranea MF3/22]
MMRSSDEGFIDGDDVVATGPAVAVDQLPLQAREELVYKLLASLPRAQIARVHRRIAPSVQVDIVGTLPSELALHVFSFLPWQELLIAALVSRRWRTLADDNSLWKRLCAQRGWVWRWPRIPHDPVPLFATSSGERDEEFHDEGVGDDEDSDGSDHGNSTGHSQTVVYHGQHHPYAFGLPATPRINPPARAATLRKPRRSSPPPVVPISRRRPSVVRRSAPSVLPAAEPPRSNYKLLHQTHILLKNRLVHGSFRFSTLQTRGTPNAHTSIIYCLQLYSYPDDARQVLFTGSKDRSVREWNLSTGNVERVFEGAHNGSILSLCVHGNYLATAGSDFCVCVWDLRDGSLAQTITDHHDSVLCVRFNSRHLVSCSKDRTVRLYRFQNTSSGKRTPPLSAGTILGTHRAAVNAVALSGSLVVSASGDKSMRVWDANTGTLLRTLEAHHARGIAAIDIAPPLVLSGSSDKHIRLFDVEKRRGWSTAPEFHDPLPTRGSRQISVCQACGGAVGDGAAAERRCVQIRRASVAASEVHTDLVRSVALGPDFVLSGSYDQSIKVWDRETGALLADLSGKHEGRVFCVGFDCTKIVSCGEDQKICIWDMSYGIDTSFIQL